MVEESDTFSNITKTRCWSNYTVCEIVFATKKCLKNVSVHPKVELPQKQAGANNLWDLRSNTDLGHQWK